MNEIELIKKVQAGDMKAFEILFEKYKTYSLRTVYLITGNQHTSEDIVQEAFVKCFLSIRSLKDPAQFKVWFFKLLTRMAWRASKKEKKLVPIEDIYDQVEKGFLADSYDNSFETQLSNEVYEEIKKLNKNLQLVIVLHYYNDLSIKEIAKVLGCFEGTVKSRLYTARKKLKDKLTDDLTDPNLTKKEFEQYGQYKPVR